MIANAGRMMQGRYRIKRPGRPPRFDKKEIQGLIGAQEKSYREIADEIGCHKSYVSKVGAEIGIFKKRGRQAA